MAEKRITGYLGALLLMALLYAPLLAWAQGSQGSQGSQGVTRLVIGFATGGPLDNLARSLAEKLRLSLDENVIVESRSGAGGIIAADAVKRSPKDGRTILISTAPPFVLFPWTYERLPYDPNKDFLPVAHLVDVPLAMVARADRPYKTLPQYLDWARKNSDALSIGMVSLGGTLHFGVTSMAKALDIPFVPVAYRGGTPLMTDLIGGNLPMGIDAVATMNEMVKSGKLRFLAVTGTQRTPLLPDVPTFKELGIDGFDNASAWYSAFVPAGTPPEVVARLETALLDALKDPALRAKMAELGMVVTGLSAQQTASLVQSQRAAWEPVVRRVGFKADQ